MFFLMILLGLTWEYRTGCTGARTYPAIGTVVAANASGDSCIYVIGGQGAGGQTTTNYEYNCLTNAWTTRNAMPAPVRYDFAGCSANRSGTRRIYVLGGYQSFFNYLADVDEYTPSTNTWLSRTDMPTAREGVRAACVGNMIYAIGGDNIAFPSPYVTGIVERYDPEANSWTTGYASMPTPRTDACCAIGVNEFGDTCIYVFGGSTSVLAYVPTNAVEEYHPATNTWRVRSNTGFTARGGSQAVYVPDSNIIYVIGGTSDGSSSLNLVQVYNPATNSWRAETPIQQPRDGITGGYVYDRLYAVVGSNGASIVNTNERTAQGIIEVEENALRPTLYSLHSFEVYPNPFSSKVSIVLRAEAKGQSAKSKGINTLSTTPLAPCLKIYDATGRLVKSFNHLTNYQSPIIWSGDDDLGQRVPAGVYFVQNKIGDFREIKKVVKIR